jgi:hypothetical protein
VGWVYRFGPGCELFAEAVADLEVEVVLGVVDAAGLCADLTADLQQRNPVSGLWAERVWVDQLAGLGDQDKAVDTVTHLAWQLVHEEALGGQGAARQSVRSAMCMEGEGACANVAAWRPSKGFLRPCVD